MLRNLESNVPLARGVLCGARRDRVARASAFVLHRSLNSRQLSQRSAAAAEVATGGEVRAEVSVQATAPPAMREKITGG